MSDRIAQLAARMQAHGVNFMGARGGKSELGPLDIAAAFGFIVGAETQAIASYYYRVGDNKNGAIDALYLLLAREQHRQQTALTDLLWRHCGGEHQEWSERKALAMALQNWPTSAQRKGMEIGPPRRLREIAALIIEESQGRVKTNALIAKTLGVDPSTYTKAWAQVVNFARAEHAAAIARADSNVLDALG